MSQYICICGRSFTNSQAYNGHKSHCKTHQIAKYGDLSALKIAEEKRKTAQAEVLNCTDKTQ